MSVILALLQKPIFASLAGVAAIITLLWSAAPLLAAFNIPLLNTEAKKIIATVIIIIGWLIYQGISWLLGRRKNKRLAAELAKGGEVDPLAAQTEEEINTLRTVFEQSLAELKKAKLNSSKGSHLYQLPWYMIIGPPGSGKTTALINSGLNFPLARGGKAKVQGVGGTRNCDWWFTDQAVLLDTAGRYTTQDSQQQVDSAAWLEFLALLKKYRHRQPINGVIVAISLADLMQQPEAQRSAHAATVRSRILELHEKLGVGFPVYVLFTKADLIAGCMEFFDDLSREQRAQVWGMTLPLDDLGEQTEPAVERFEAEFELLEQRLNQRLIKRLQDERDPQRRDLIYAFPQQFSSLKNLAKQFLDDVFQPNRFETRSLLRGVYFTSGTQEGNPIDRLLGALAGTFGIARQSLPSFSGQGRSYFLTRLFREVIFVESGLAGTNPKLERRRRWLQRIAYASVAALTLGMGLGWFTSYARNQSYLNDVGQQLASLNASVLDYNQTVENAPDDAAVNEANVLTLLDQARGLPGADQAPPAPGWSSRLGLYQGDRLTVPAGTVYRRVLDRGLLPLMLNRIETALANGLSAEPNAGEPDQALYETLKTYRLLDADNLPEAPAAATAPATAAVAAATLDTATATDTAAVGEVVSEATAAADPSAEPAPPDPVQQAKQTIGSWFNAAWRADPAIDKEQQQRLALHLQTLLEVWPLTLPRPLDQKLIARVRAEFPERASVDELYRQLIDTDYGIAPLDLGRLLGGDAAALFVRESGASLNKAVAGVYTQPGQIVFASNSQQHIQGLADGDPVLAREPLPAAEVSRLIAAVQERYWQDYCPQWQALLADLSMAQPSGLSDAQRKLERLTHPDSPLRRLLTAVADNTASVPQCLEPLNRALTADALDPVLAQLGEMAAPLAAAVGAEQRGEKPPPDAAAQLKDQLDALGQGAPAPLDRWLQEFADPIPIWLIGGVRKIVNGLWQSEALAFCRSAFRNRYPLVPTGTRDVPLADFASFFGPNGVVDRFLFSSRNNLVSTSIDMSRTPWQWRKDVSADGIPAGKLRQLYFATQLKQAFFPANSQRPSVTFTVTPVYLEGARSARLTLAGQQLDYSGAANTAVGKRFRWPGRDGSGAAELRFEPGKTVSEDGPWGWFRLLDRAQLTRRADNLFRVDFQFGEQRASYQLQADSPVNPFTLKVADFRCPLTL